MGQAHLYLFLSIFLAMTMESGCQTDPASQVRSDAGRAMIQEVMPVELGEKISFGPPLGNCLTIKERMEGPRETIGCAWDFDEDGYVDVVENFKPDDSDPHYWFDFDGDGKVDGLSRTTQP